ncbi:MAG TPA: T9SS type A sorting domain-containing protein, partial [Candidatus Eisenbacteria bacterium]|nr:T9SS type A sorting domain-containing protein [Candidatus Eisenbacteria bacterium]
SAGSSWWVPDGIPVCTLTTPQYYPTIAPDGAGGAIVAWEEGSTNRNIHAQRVGSNGALLWTTSGIGICSEAYTQSSVQIFPDGAGGAFLVWLDTRNSNVDFYAQRVDADGNLLWPAGGAPVCTEPTSQSDIACALNGAAGMIFAWDNYRNGVDLDIYSSMMGMDGQPVSTLLQAFDIALDGRSIVVEWTLSESVDPREFAVSRREAANAGEWTAITVDIDDNGANYSFTDDTCLRGTSYSYRVELLEEGAQRVLFETEPMAVPGMSMMLDQNHPNPFNPSTTIRFYLPERTCVSLCVFDISGRLVSKLVTGISMPEGFHEALWDGNNDDGAPAASGVYLYRLEAGKSSRTRKMILLR